MAFLSAYELSASQRKSGGRSGISNISSAITFAIDRQWANNKWRYSVRIGMTPKIYSDARFIDGDRFDVQFDPDSRMAKIVRVNSGGWMATPTGKQKSARRVMKFAWFEGMPSVDKTVGCEIVSIDTNTITFKLPEGVSFKENLRLNVENQKEGLKVAL